MAASTLNNWRATMSGLSGWRRADSGFCGFGTTMCFATPTRCLKRFGWRLSKRKPPLPQPLSRKRERGVKTAGEGRQEAAEGSNDMHHAFKLGDREYNVELSRSREGYRLHFDG